MHRRRFVASVAAGSVVATTGCLDDVLDGLTEHEAVPVTVSVEALDDAGYERDGVTAMVVTEEVAGEEIRVTNYFAEYHRHLELDPVNAQEAGVFATISSPRFSIAGEEFNPIADWENEDVAEQIQDQYEELSIGESVGVRTVEPLDLSAEVETFEGEARFQDLGQIDVYVDVGQFDHEDDHVVVLGVYPRKFPNEDERVTTLVEGLRHDGDGIEIDEEVEE